MSLKYKQQEGEMGMNSIEVMVKEHELITRALKVMRQACYGILKGEALQVDDFYAMADFVKDYAQTRNKIDRFTGIIMIRKKNSYLKPWKRS